MCIRVVSLTCIPLSWHLEYINICLFPKLGNFSAIISLNTIFALFFLSFFIFGGGGGTPITCYVKLLISTHGPLSLYFSSIFFLLLLQISHWLPKLCLFFYLCSFFFTLDTFIIIYSSVISSCGHFISNKYYLLKLQNSYTWFFFSVIFFWWGLYLFIHCKHIFFYDPELTYLVMCLRLQTSELFGGCLYCLYP